MRLLALLTLLVAVLPALAAEPDVIAPTDALTPADELKKFKLPEGFTAQLVASEPEIQKPMQMCFDAKGRLWVTTSHLYPFPAEAGKGTDKLFVLSDFGDDGRAKKIEVFDDKLNIPIGVLPLPDGKSVIVSEAGKILKLTDTKGTGKADQREVLFEGFGFRDTHGMTNSYTLMPDGWVYACHGFSNDSKVKGKDGHEVVMNSGNTFRFKPDGSRIEVYTRGQVNPFGMCVDPWLNLYDADCHSRPMTQLIRGAYYDSFGKPHDGLGYAPHVINHMHGSTGLCGLVYYAADHFPKEWQGVMFVGNVVTCKINCDRIEWKGATPVGKELPDFLSSDDPWFRPTDLKLGPDGAMYVTDFYNKIIGHYEVDLKHPGRDKDHGRIWRIVYTGKDGKGKAPTMPRADWSKASEKELTTDFASPNTTVRLLAANAAAARPKFTPDATGLAKDSEALGVSVILTSIVRERHDDFSMKTADTAIQTVKKNDLGIPIEAYPLGVVKALTTRVEWGDDERKLALDCFNSFDSVRVKRAVIDGVTAHPHPDFIEPLLAFNPKIAADDVVMKQAARIALRNCLDSAGAKVPLAIDPKGRPADYLPLTEALLGCTTPQPAVALEELLHARMVRDQDAFEAGRRVGRYGGKDGWGAVASHLSKPTADDINPTRVRALAGLFRGIQEAGFAYDPKGPRAQAEVFAQLVSGALGMAWESLTQNNQVMNQLGLEVYREVRKSVSPDKLPSSAEPFARETIKVVNNTTFTTQQQVAASEVLLSFEVKGGRQAVQKYADESDPNSATRGQLVALLLAHSPTTTDCTLAVTEMKTAPYTQAVAYASALAGDKFGADLLLASIRKGEAPARLLQEKSVTERLMATGVKDLDAKLKDLTKNIPPAEKRVEDLIKARAVGFPKAKTDTAKGKAVFTKSCAVCHQLNNEGAKVGPQLDGVGIRGVARLLEDTLDPNRNVDQAFRATKLDLKDGQSLTGLVREDGAVYVLTDGTGKEHRIPAADVDNKTVTNASPMPANLDTVMTEEEYYHLLAFLLEQKPKK